MIDEDLANAKHLAGKAFCVPWRENRRHRLTRPFPDLAFRRQEAVAQDRAQDQPPDIRHFVVGGVLDEDIADEAGIVDDKRPLIDELRLDPGKRVGRLAPELERVSQNRADDLEPRGDAGARDGRGRLEWLRSRIHVYAFPRAIPGKVRSGSQSGIAECSGRVPFQFFTAQSRKCFT